MQAIKRFYLAGRLKINIFANFFKLGNKEVLYMKGINRIYSAPETQITEVRFEKDLLVATGGLGVGSGNGSKNVEGRQDGGSWGNGDWY